MTPKTSRSAARSLKRFESPRHLHPIATQLLLPRWIWAQTVARMLIAQPKGTSFMYGRQFFFRNRCNLVPVLERLWPAESRLDGANDPKPCDLPAKK